MRATSFILFGLLSCIYVRGAEEALTTQYPARNTTSVDTTSVETPENTTPITLTTEFQALIEPITEELILHLQTKNTVVLKDSSNLLSEIEDDVVRFSASLNQQLKDVQQLGPMELQFAKSSYLVKKLSLNLLQGLSNTTYKVGLDIERTVQTLENMVKEQQEVKKRVNQLQEKLNDYQINIVNNSQLIDNGIVHLTKLVSRSVLPKLDNLKSQFSSLNTSQINIKAELPNIDVTKAINEKSITKLNDINQQLAYVNRIKDTQLQKVTDILEYLAPKNLTVIANTLQDLVINEKRIDLKISINEQLSTCSSSTSKTAYRGSSQKEKYQFKYLKSKRSSESYENQKIHSRQESENIALNINNLKSEQQYQTEDLIYELPESKPEMYSNQKLKPQGRSLNNPFYSQQSYQREDLKTKSEEYEVFEINQPTPKPISKQENLASEKPYIIPETVPKSQERSLNNPFYCQSYQLEELKPKSEEYEVFEINEPASQPYSRQKNLAPKRPIEVSYLIPETVPKSQKRSLNNPFYSQQSYQLEELKPKSEEYKIYAINQPAPKPYSEGQKHLAPEKPVEVSYSIPETVGNYDNEEALKFIESLELNPNLILQSEVTSPKRKPFEIYNSVNLHTEHISNSPDNYVSDANARDHFLDIETYQTYDNMKEIYSINNAQIA